jgi:apolipoprotein D and lipocalin family protein
VHRLILLGALALAACGAKEPVLRDGEATIASAALFDPARFVDVWHVVAAFGAEAGCGPLSETWAPAPGGFSVTGTACGPSGARAFAGKARLTGPGRITREGLNGTEEIWVLWVDADYRVAVIGTPDGSFGRILSRTPEVRPDLMTAAREVLDFNGYEVTGLKLTGGGV